MTLNRREVLRMMVAAGTAGALAACGLDIKPTSPPATPAAEHLPFSEFGVQQKVFELLDTYPPEDPNIEKVYRDTGAKVPYLHETYNLPFDIGALQENAIAYNEMYTGTDTFSPNDRFKYHDASGAEFPHPTFQHVSGKVEFSPIWYRMKTPEAQMIVIKQQARTILQNQGYSIYAYLQLDKRGDFIPIDPAVTVEEMAIKTGYSMRSVPAINKRHEFAAFIPLLQEYDDLTKTATPDLMADLSLFAVPSLHREVQKRNIPYQDYEFNTPEFYEFAYSDTSPWAQFIDMLKLNQPALLVPNSQAQFVYPSPTLPSFRHPSIISSVG